MNCPKFDGDEMVPDHVLALTELGSLFGSGDAFVKFLASRFEARADKMPKSKAKH
jgi:hypothetical protein